MTMPLILTNIIPREEWVRFEKAQFEQFERIVVTEALANQQFMQTLKGKVGELKNYKG